MRRRPPDPAVFCKITRDSALWVEPIILPNRGPPAFRAQLFEPRPTPAQVPKDDKDPNQDRHTQGARDIPNKLFTTMLRR